MSMNENEPVYSIGRIFTSLKLAAIAVVTIVALMMEWDDATTAAVVGGVSAIVVVAADIVGYVMTRERVTPYHGGDE